MTAPDACEPTSSEIQTMPPGSVRREIPADPGIIRAAQWLAELSRKMQLNRRIYG